MYLKQSFRIRSPHVSCWALTSQLWTDSHFYLWGDHLTHSSTYNDLISDTFCQKNYVSSTPLKQWCFGMLYSEILGKKNTFKTSKIFKKLRFPHYSLNLPCLIACLGFFFQQVKTVRLILVGTLMYYSLLVSLYKLISSKKWVRNGN